MEQMLLMVDLEKCTGCGTCEFACSLKHFGECNPSRSFIKPLRYDMMGARAFNISV